MYKRNIDKNSIIKEKDINIDFIKEEFFQENVEVFYVTDNKDKLIGVITPGRLGRYIKFNNSGGGAL